MRDKGEAGRGGRREDEEDAEEEEKEGDFEAPRSWHSLHASDPPHLLTGPAPQLARTWSVTPTSLTLSSWDPTPVSFFARDRPRLQPVPATPDILHVTGLVLLRPPIPSTSYPNVAPPPPRPHRARHPPYSARHHPHLESTLPDSLSCDPPQHPFHVRNPVPFRPSPHRVRRLPTPNPRSWTRFSWGHDDEFLSRRALPQHPLLPLWGKYPSHYPLPGDLDGEYRPV